MKKQAVYALLAGFIFALGLVLAGMTQPAKVIGFLNVTGLAKGISWTAQAGYWDPSLGLVMGGALSVTLLAFALTNTQGAPWADKQFHLPKKTDIDRPLLIGAVLFGAGWGLAGYCPGPALASVLTGGFDAFVFVATMLAAMWGTKRYLARST